MSDKEFKLTNLKYSHLQSEKQIAFSSHPDWKNKKVQVALFREEWQSTSLHDLQIDINNKLQEIHCFNKELLGVIINIETPCFVTVIFADLPPKEEKKDE